MASLSKKPRMPAPGARRAMFHATYNALNQMDRAWKLAIQYRPGMEKGQLMGLDADELERFTAQLALAFNQLQAARKTLNSIDAKMLPAEQEAAAKKAARQAQLDLQNPSRVCRKCWMHHSGCTPEQREANKERLPERCPKGPQGFCQNCPGLNGSCFKKLPLDAPANCPAAVCKYCGKPCRGSDGTGIPTGNGGPICLKCMEKKGV